MVSVTRRVHIKNQTNSLSDKKMARVCVLGVHNIKCKKAYFLKPVTAYHDHQNSAQEGERPENKSLDELIGEQLTN